MRAVCLRQSKKEYGEALREWIDNKTKAPYSVGVLVFVQILGTDMQRGARTTADAVRRVVDGSWTGFAITDVVDE